MSDNANDFVGTGTQIEAKDQTGQQGTYIAFLYGDVNGDGLVNLTDARKILSNTLNGSLEEIYEKAGNVDNSENSIETDLVDARRILSFVIGSGDLINNKVEKDTTIPVIEVTPETIEISVGDTFTKTEALQGVKATDNLDGDITSRIKISGLDKVNTSKEGTYIIKYNVKDYSGNVAEEVTRSIVVKGNETPDVPDIPNDDVLASMNITDNGTNITSLNLEIGATKTLGVKFMNADGKEIDASDITITPSTSIADITKKDSKTIQVVAKSEGRQTITVKSGEVTSTFTLIVTKPGLGTISLGVSNISVTRKGVLKEENNAVKIYEKDNQYFLLIPVTFKDTNGKEVTVTGDEFITPTTNNPNYFNDGSTNKYNIVADEDIKGTIANIRLFTKDLLDTTTGDVKYIGVEIYTSKGNIGKSGNITLQYGNTSNVRASFRVNIVE